MCAFVRRSWGSEESATSTTRSAVVGCALRSQCLEAEHRQASGPWVHSQAHLVPVVGLEVEVRAIPELARPSRQEGPMRVLLVHPSPLLFSEIYLRLEPLGVERVGAALAAAGHEVRLLDLQVWRHGDYRR